LLSYDRNDSLRIAYIHTEKVLKDGKLETEYYSKLIKADLSGKDQVLPHLMMYFEM
jgi:callose synthase